MYEIVYHENYCFSYNSIKTKMNEGDSKRNLGPGCHIMAATGAGKHTFCLWHRCQCSNITLPPRRPCDGPSASATSRWHVRITHISLACGRGTMVHSPSYKITMFFICFIPLDKHISWNCSLREYAMWKTSSQHAHNLVYNGYMVPNADLKYLWIMGNARILWYVKIWSYTSISQLW